MRRRIVVVLTSVLVSALTMAGGHRGPAAAVPSEPTLVASAKTTSNATSYPLGTVSFTGGRLYLLFLTLSETGGAVDATPGVRGPGTDWTKIDVGQASAGPMGLTAYYFRPESDLPLVDLSTDTLSTLHEGAAFSIVEVAEANAVTPVTQYSAGNRGPATSYTRTLPATPMADSLVVGAFTHGANEASRPNAGWSEVAGSDLSHASPARGTNVVYDNTDPAATAGASWATSVPRRGVVVEVPSTDAVSSVTIAAAGDICGGCASTSLRVLDAKPDAVITLGDLAYNNGLLSEFLQRYGGGTTPQVRWGRPAIKDITLPGYGNHDCVDYPPATGATKQGCDDAVTYFGPDDSFGTDIPGTPGSYHTVVGDWLVVHLNSAGDVGSGQATAAEIADQNAALQVVLEADTHECEIVVWHHPRFSSGGDHGSNPFVDPWFETAYANGVEVVLSGHDHDYERFAPQDGDGNAAPDGVQQFVVGTGGSTTEPFATVQRNSLVRIVDKGILTMQLRDNGTYTWAFVDDTANIVDDSGSGTCTP